MSDRHPCRHGLFRDQPQEETPPGERVWRRFLQAARYITGLRVRGCVPEQPLGLINPALPASPAEAAAVVAEEAEPGRLP